MPFTTMHSSFSGKIKRIVKQLSYFVCPLGWFEQNASFVGYIGAEGVTFKR